MPCFTRGTHSSGLPKPTVPRESPKQGGSPILPRRAHELNPTPEMDVSGVVSRRIWARIQLQSKTFIYKKLFEKKLFKKFDKFQSDSLWSPKPTNFVRIRIRIRICTVVLRRSAGNIGARRLLTSTRGLLTFTGTGSCTCFSWVAARTHMYYSSAVRVAGPGDDSSRCLRVQAVHADLACRAAALGVEEVDRGLKCGL